MKQVVWTSRNSQWELCRITSATNRDLCRYQLEHVPNGSTQTVTFYDHKPDIAYENPETVPAYVQNGIAALRKHYGFFINS